MRPLLLAAKPAVSVLWAGLALVLFGLAPAATRADVIIGNLAAGDGSNVQINDTYIAASFTMGSQAYLMSDVQVRLQGNVPSDLAFQIRDDATGNPSNNVLLTFESQSINTTATATYTFNATSLFTVTADSTFWLVAFSNSPARLVDSNLHTDPSGPGATFGQYQQSSNGIAWVPLSSEPKFQLNGLPVVGSPEPSSLVMVGTVACVAAAAGWRRRRTRRAP